MNRAIFEMLEEANTHKNIEDRVTVLQRYSSKIVWMLDNSYNPKVEWLVPEGEPPFTPTQDSDGTTLSRLFFHQRKIPIFLKGGRYPNMDRMKREKLFVELLEDLHIKEAKLLCNIKDGDMLKGYRRLNLKVIKKAFPKLVESWEVKKDEE